MGITKKRTPKCDFIDIKTNRCNRLLMNREIFGVQYRKKCLLLKDEYCGMHVFTRPKPPVGIGFGGDCTSVGPVVTMKNYQIGDQDIHVPVWGK